LGIRFREGTRSTDPCGCRQRSSIEARLGFSWTGWIKSTNQFAFNSYITLGGNLITDNPRRHGKLTGITSV
jgi:hypothetical protein